MWRLTWHIFCFAQGGAMMDMDMVYHVHLICLFLCPILARYRAVDS
ncbi:MAG: hypothetical protein ABIH23_23200 [bacterium]